MRDGNAFLKVSLLKSDESLAKDSVDINMSEIVVGKDDFNYVRIPTRLDDAHHYKNLLPLQEKYDKEWKGERENIK